ncbi:putative Major facilitator superfamily (MFS) profile domain-containing protein [Seiridium cardinale]|uniref:Major facilitator superfamily (MFS) profile domain-containing protein n=1 Tax=Seiridium cardinale TaxID=138064 RepID=A0ABR2Y488_9PEZI
MQLLETVVLSDPQQHRFFPDGWEFRMGTDQNNRITGTIGDGEKRQRLEGQDTATEPTDPEGLGTDSSVRVSGVEVGDTVTPSLPLSKARCIALVVTVTGASFLNTLTVQAVVIILPTIGEDLGIPESRLQWVVSAYSLTFGCFLLLWGRIADIFGKKLIFILGSAFAAATLIVNPFLRNEIAFDLFRGLQGIGGAANVPTAIGILGVTFPPGKAKNYAFSTYAAGAPLGSVFGNLLGGLIASYANWKWVFGANAILAVAVTAAGVFLIPPPPPETKAKKHGKSLARTVDWFGGFLITAGILCLLFALTEGNVVGWKTVWIYLLIVIALLFIGIFVAWQWYQEKHTNRPPLMKVSLFRNKSFSVAMILMAVFFSTFNDFLIFATYFYQDYQDLGPLQTTLRFLPTGIAGIIVAFVVSRLISKIPTYLFLLFGNLAVAISCLLFAVPIPPQTSYFAYGLFAMILSVIGADMTWPSLTLFVSKSVPQEDQALGGALINACGQTGRAIGLAITTAIQTAVLARERGVPVEESGGIEPWDAASLYSLRVANWFNFSLAILGVAIVGFAFRGTGIVGKIEKPPPRTGGEEGVMNQEDTRKA